MDSNPVGASEFFSGLYLQLLKLLHKCEDYFHMYFVNCVYIDHIYTLRIGKLLSLVFCEFS